MGFLVLNFMQKIGYVWFIIKIFTLQIPKGFNTEIYWAFGDIRNDTDSIAIKIFNI